MKMKYNASMNSTLSSLRFPSAALIALLVWGEHAHAFAPVKISRAIKSTTNLNFKPSRNGAATQLSSHLRRNTSMQGASIDDISDREWIPLVDSAGNDKLAAVRKHILEEGEGDLPPKGSTIEIEYTGTLLGEKDWFVNDVVECWLSQLQGLDHLSPTFIENEIDGTKLMDGSFFTEEYCMDQLGISNKIQAKKLIMASRRLIKQQEEYAPGSEFDSSITRGKNYSFVSGQGRVIKAMELAVSSMKVGERAMLACRADYAYGSEGLRTSKGDVMVPPFATLCFDLKLVSATS
mmetsp:Transcript_43196/g.78933  ORF Transcript_43196/g.78933 Transcript_43196/m.78933 type:complete len:292 (-) Transcript_43196:106-981(-)